MPLVHWFRRELQQELISLLLEPRTIQRGYLDRRSVAKLIAEHSTERRDRSVELWTLLVFELWHRNFLESATQVPAAVTL